MPYVLIVKFTMHYHAGATVLLTLAGLHVTYGLVGWCGAGGEIASHFRQVCET